MSAVNGHLELTSFSDTDEILLATDCCGLKGIKAFMMYRVWKIIISFGMVTASHHPATDSFPIAA